MIICSDTSTIENRFLGCLLGGAIGDSLGYPIEWMNLEDIKINGFVQAPRINSKGVSYVSDDTQMSILTAFGLCNNGDKLTNIFNAYTRWIDIMYNGQNLDDTFPELREYPSMFEPRGTGLGCYHSLQSKKPRSVTKPINNNKGAGTIMRIAPVGLMYSDTEQAFINGMNISALTHGHSTGYLGAGAFASIISMVSRGQDLLSAIETAIDILKKHKAKREIFSKINLAIKLSNSNTSIETSIKTIGEGWVTEEALALAIYCALKTDSFRDGLIISVNHDGDSDTVGAVTGNLLGAMYGVDYIPQDWIQHIEFRDLIISLSKELYKKTS